VTRHVTSHTLHTNNMSQDFLGATANSDFDFDRAASAFPDIEGLDGNVPTSIPHDQPSFDDFDLGGATQFSSTLKITEPDELDKFTSDFPELEPQVFPFPNVLKLEF
jgi:hypothetical protein